MLVRISKYLLTKYAFRGLVKQLKFYVSSEDKPDLLGDVQSKYFNIKSLIEVISDGISKWAATFNDDKDKIPPFFERYDMIISDSRYGRVNYNCP